MSAPLHLVSLWNPTYKVDALEAHAELLLDWVQDAHDGVVEWDEAYVWWGRVRSPNRQQPLAHLPQVLALDAESRARELQLYLTDYRSLYVARVTAIATGDQSVADPEHTPASYAADALSCDCWFRISDLRCLVQDDTVATQDELRTLLVTTYNDKPVSLYGGMVDLPLIVRRPDGSRLFDEREMDALNDGRRWVQADAERTGLSGLVRDLQDNVIGEAAWRRLLPTARSFVATAERLMRDHRREGAFDFSTVVVELCKALEVQVNAILGEVAHLAPPEVRYYNVAGSSVDLASGRGLTVGQLSGAIASTKERMDFFSARLTEGRFMVEELPSFLEEVAEYRNPAAHSERRSRAQILPLRNRIVGVGEEGILVRLARVEPR
jgi:hypothetical protein